jgi:small subunit ribosomal protein S20
LTARSTSAYKRGERGWAYDPALIAFQAAARIPLASAAAAKEPKFMANTKSAQKAVRKIARRTAVNKMRRSQTRTSVRKVEEALEAKDAAAAAEAFRAAEPLLARSAQKGIVHKNAASRKISRLAKRVKALAV